MTGVQEDKIKIPNDGSQAEGWTKTNEMNVTDYRCWDLCRSEENELRGSGLVPGSKAHPGPELPTCFLVLVAKLLRAI